MPIHSLYSAFLLVMFMFYVYNHNAVYATETMENSFQRHCQNTKEKYRCEEVFHGREMDIVGHEFER